MAKITLGSAVEKFGSKKALADVVGCAPSMVSKLQTIYEGNGRIVRFDTDTNELVVKQPVWRKVAGRRN